VIGQREIDAVSECLQSGWIGAGARVERFENEFARYKGARYAAALSSGTAAIHISLVALGIGAGDEVIAPAMTFPSTIHAILHTGATPTLVDCDRLTFNMDPNLVERRVTSRTRAIVVVHMCGRCVEMAPISAIARKHNLRVIEDCAHAIESNYRGTPSGLLGDAGCFSFYATKNITTGDGGMVITENQRLFRKIKMLSLHGMTADAWTRARQHTTDYKVVEAGFKYNMTDIEAALGLAQFEEIESRWGRRRKVWKAYDEGLKQLPLLLPPPAEPKTRHAYHLYTPLLQIERLRARRKDVIAALRAENIGVGVHYVPVHLQPYYRKRFGFRRADFPNATFVGERTISLPLSAGLSDRDVSDVCRALTRVLRHYA
jgi:dTDP-4-amino-4,6-dideoxygalactose transaminase